MSARVVCPHCGKAIKLRDRSLLGKKGKCPGCAKAFLLFEQAADEEVIPLALADEEPAVGTGARWVPDEPVTSVESSSTAALALPDFDFNLGADAPVRAPTSSASSPARPIRKARNKTPAWIGIAVASVLVVGGGLYLSLQTPPPAEHASAAPTSGTAVAVSPAPASVYSRESLTADLTLVAEFRPTQGQPIPLNLLTGANNILIHLRPDRIWGTGQDSMELKASLTEDVASWLESQIQKFTRRHPDQIEELLIGISAVSKVETPQISTVFRLKTPEKRSALILEFNGTEISAPGKPVVTQKDGFAYYIQDDRTIAICPAALGDDLADAVAKPLECVTDGIAELLTASDRERSFTVFLDVPDSLTYADQLFEPSTIPAMTHVLESFGPDAETVSWSVNLGSTFHSEIRVRPKGSHSGTARISTADSLKKDYEQRLPSLVEHDLLDAVRMMRPNRSGFRQIIGRFPAMVEAFRQATILHPGPKFLTMTTVLPRKAAPNLALGTVLAWDESTRTNWGSSDPEKPVASREVNLPKTVLGRLKTEFEIEFSRKPLADAFAYLGEETQVTFVVDGDALKMAGYTKNMPQTFSLGKAPGTQGVYTILTWPMQEKMCLVVDDAKMQALITTTAAAEAKGLKVVPIESLKSAGAAK